MSEFAIRAQRFETHIREVGLAVERYHDTSSCSVFRVPFDPSDPCRLEWHHDAGEFMIDLSFWHRQNPLFCLSRLQYTCQPASHLFLFWDLGHARDDRGLPREVREFIKDLSVDMPCTPYQFKPSTDVTLSELFVSRYQQFMTGEAR